MNDEMIVALYLQKDEKALSESALKYGAKLSLLHNGFTGNCRVEFPEVAK
jgi:hypothetical protein